LDEKQEIFIHKIRIFEKNTFASLLFIDFSKYLVFPFSRKFADFAIGHTPSWYLLVAVGWFVLGIPAIFAIYKGKKWGAYVLLAFLPISFITYQFFFHLPVYSAVIFYIGIILFLYLLYRQWKHLK